MCEWFLPGICAYLNLVKRNTLRGPFTETDTRCAVHLGLCSMHRLLYLYMKVNKVPVVLCNEEWSHLFMPVEVGILQVGCVAAWFTAAINQVDISKCCSSVNKTLTCTLLWHFKPSQMQTTWTLPKARRWQPREIFLGEKSDKRQAGAVNSKLWVSHRLFCFKNKS